MFDNLVEYRLTVTISDNVLIGYKSCAMAERWKTKTMTTTTSLWTWGGAYFGRREGDELWTHDGRHVGRFRGDEIYGQDGQYLGELKSGKLVTKASKLGRSGPRFSPRASRVGHVPYVGHVGTILYAGYEDFPAPDAFR